MRGRVLGGLAWMGGAQVVMQAMRMVVAVIVARILAPEEFGIAALAVVFSGLVLVFSDMALGAALIQRKVLTEDDRSTAFWMSVGAGALFTALGLALSPAIAAFYGEPSVTPLCMALSLTFMITSLATTQEALMLRDMRFAQLEQRTVFATLVGAVTCVIVAVKTQSAWAIIAQEVAYSIVSAVLLWKFGTWRPKFSASMASLRSLAGFSGYLVGHRLLWYAHRNADNILIGRFVGAAALGAYSIAYNIMLVPISRLGGPLQKVLGPALSRMQDEPQRVADAWVRVVRLVSLLTVPALGGLIVVAPDFVQVVLGEKWHAAIPLIQILAVVGILQALQAVSTDILQARGRTRTIFRFSLLFTGAHTVAFVIGLHWGVVGVAAGYAISSILVEPIYLWLTARSIGITPMPVLRAVRGAFEASLVMAAVVFAAREGLVELGVGSFGRLVLLILVGILVYVPASLWRSPEAWRDVRGILGPVLARKAPRLRLPGLLAGRLAAKTAAPRRPARVAAEERP
jgi:O-antigen/teichoic acid export membrane protein